MTDEDVLFLTSPEAQPWLRLAAGERDSLKVAKQLRKELSADRARLVIEQADAPPQGHRQVLIGRANVLHASRPGASNRRGRGPLQGGPFSGQVRRSPICAAASVAT